MGGLIRCSFPQIRRYGTCHRVADRYVLSKTLYSLYFELGDKFIISDQQQRTLTRMIHWVQMRILRLSSLLEYFLLYETTRVDI